MSGAKEIRSKIGSIKNTQKITSAMELVAASKMRKAQERMASSKPYAQHMRKVIGHVAKANLEYRHPFTVDRDVKRVGYILVATDRGLCGGLNINLFKAALAHMKAMRESGAEIKLCLIGQKALAFFKRFGGEVLAQTSHLGDEPELTDLIGTVKVMLDAFESGEIDRLYLAYNDFVNTMTQTPKVEQLLPIKPQEDSHAPRHTWDYIYEPDPKSLLDKLLTRYIESLVYQAVVENVACEMAARMVAMKAATDNAGKLIDELQLAYNKARQASITQELSEIVAGAAAV